LVTVEVWRHFGPIDDSGSMQPINPANWSKEEFESSGHLLPAMRALDPEGFAEISTSFGWVSIGATPEEVERLIGEEQQWVRERAVNASVAGPTAEPTTKAESTLRFLFSDQLDALEDPFDFIDGTLYDGQVSVLYGAPGTGKTFFVLDLALHVALGRPWRGRKVEQGGVLYIALEGGGGIRKRHKAWCKRYDVNPDSVPIAFAEGFLNLRKDQATRDAIAAFVDEARARWGAPVRWIIVDTLSRALAGGNESSSEDMSALIDGADRLRAAARAHITFIHHPGKDETRGSRGWSGLLGAVDTEIEITRKGGIGVAAMTKQKEGADGLTWAFNLETVDLGYADRRGKPVTSCVAVAAAMPTKQEKLSDRETAALDLLREMTTGGPVLIEAWRKAGSELGKVSAHDEYKRRHEAMSRAVTALTRKERISLAGEFVSARDTSGWFENVGEGQS
jgi:hypothetical protein